MTYDDFLTCERVEAFLPSLPKQFLVIIYLFTPRHDVHSAEYGNYVPLKLLWNIAITGHTTKQPYLWL